MKSNVLNVDSAAPPPILPSFTTISIGNKSSVVMAVPSALPPPPPPPPSLNLPPPEEVILLDELPPPPVVNPWLELREDIDQNDPIGQYYYGDYKSFTWLEEEDIVDKNIIFESGKSQPSGNKAEDPDSENESSSNNDNNDSESASSSSNGAPETKSFYAASLDKLIEFLTSHKLIGIL